jgi:hypothetical protein
MGSNLNSSQIDTHRSLCCHSWWLRLFAPSLLPTFLATRLAVAAVVAAVAARTVVDDICNKTRYRVKSTIGG